MQDNFRFLAVTTTALNANNFYEDVDQALEEKDFRTTEKLSVSKKESKVIYLEQSFLKTYKDNISDQITALSHA